MSVSPSATASLPCEDISFFKEALKNLRIIDDRINNRLNTELPTESFKGSKNPSYQCELVYNELKQSYTARQKAIQTCVDHVSLSVKQLQSEKAAKPDDYNVASALRNELSKLRMMQSEQVVEEVIEEKTLKTFNDRCHAYYSPPK